jgi:hypothetical protein
MGVRVTSLANATNDGGLVTAGLCPRDNYIPVTFSGTSSPTLAYPTNTENGLPFVASTTATIGVNEMLDFDFTEPFPVRCGTTVFWKPEDPLDFTFKDVGQVVVPNNNPDEIQASYPAILVGVTGAASASTFLLEVVLHVEYTQGPFVASSQNLGTGKNTADQLMATTRSIFGQATSTAIKGLVNTFVDSSAPGRLVKAGANYIANKFAARLSNTYSSSDNQQMVVRRGGRRYDTMELD